MHYRSLVAIISVALLGTVAVLFFYPTPLMYIVCSALVPLLLGVLVVGVLRSPAGEATDDKKGPEDGYDLS